MYDPEKHHRKSIRLKQYDYSSQGAYFITLVTKNRENFFGEIVQGEMILSKMGKIAHNNWLEISNHFENVVLDEFVIMPNHVHGVIFLKEMKRDVKFYVLTEEKTVHSNSHSNFDDGTPHSLTKEENSNSNSNCGGVKLYALTEEKTVHSNSHSNFDDGTPHSLTKEENSNSNSNCGGVKLYALTEEKTVHSNSHSNFDDGTPHSLTKEENSNSNSNCGGVKLYAQQNEQQQTTLVKQKNNYFSNLSPKKNTISSIIRAYKASVTSNCKKNNYPEFQWQKNYYEHIIRNEKALNNIRKYINENPMKWNLDRENEKSEFEKYKFKSIQEINNFDIKNDL